jgi:Uma2 family endonuclease
MATQPVPPHWRITADEFLAMDLEGRFELVDGVIYAMGGGTAQHSAVTTNILAALGAKLRGSRCRPFNGDLAVKLLDDSVRYPDATVYCGVEGRGGDALVLGDPRVVIEVLSPSTKAYDSSTKLDGYRELPGVEAVLLVDGAAQRVRIVERTGPEAWSDRWLAQGGDVPIACLGIVLTADEIFAD